MHVCTLNYYLTNVFHPSLPRSAANFSRLNSFESQKCSELMTNQTPSILIHCLWCKKKNLVKNGRTYVRICLLAIIEYIMVGQYRCIFLYIMNTIRTILIYSRAIYKHIMKSHSTYSFFQRKKMTTEKQREEGERKEEKENSTENKLMKNKRNKHTYLSIILRMQSVATSNISFSNYYTCLKRQKMTISYFIWLTLTKPHKNIIQLDA